MTPRERYKCQLCHIAIKHGCTLDEMLGRRRTPRIAQARFHGYAALREKGLTIPHIARFFGRDHTTVGYGLARVPELQGVML